MLDAHFERRMRRYTDAALDEQTLDDAYRAVARLMFDDDRREPEWSPLLLEFWSHASTSASQAGTPASSSTATGCSRPAR